MLASGSLSDSQLRHIYLLRVILENMLLHSLISYNHAASLKRKVTQGMICSAFLQGAGLETLYAALLIYTIE